MSTGAVGLRPRHVALVLPRVAGRLWAVTRSCLARFFTHSRLWEISLATLPPWSRTFPCTSGPLPSRTRYASSCAAAVGDPPRHVAHVLRPVAGLTGAVARSPRHTSRLVQAVTRAGLAHGHSDPSGRDLFRLVANAGQVVSNTSLLGAGWNPVAAR